MLRGGCWATDPLACRTTFRNWDHPIRRQIFAGFRTARDATDVPAPGLPRRARARCRRWSSTRRTRSTSSPGRRAGSGTAPSTSTASAPAGTSTAAEPVRYRRAQPIWTDASFASLAPTIATSCAVAAVRSATAGTSADEAAAAPFTHGRWLFSHNGRLHDWATARKALRPQAADVPDTRVGVDSALLFGLAAGPLAGRRARCPPGWPAPRATCSTTAGAG